jgi:hypothetical protein
VRGECFGLLFADFTEGVFIVLIKILSCLLFDFAGLIPIFARFICIIVTYLLIIKFKNVMRKLIVLAIVVVSLFSSCAKHITVAYSPASERTGKIVIKPSRPIAPTSLTLNDKLLVEGKNIKKITITDVPEGTHKVNLVSNSWQLKESIDAKIDVTVKPGNEVTKLVQVPPYSTGYWIYLTGSFATSMAILLLL